MKTYKQLAEAATRLCQEIEKLPAGAQETEVSIMAANLAADIRQRAEVQEYSAHVMNWPA
ncbi:MAG TPA: hypothetical protein VGY56_10640 [Verrucomicrobiae bacterium]|nr:hypothetical protein [Verrucomicrobiae bacterium]